VKKLILGSGSPRRRELLSELGFSFEVRTKDTDESCDGVPANEQALFVAEKKAIALIDTLAENEILLCADTVVIHNQQTLNKPSDRVEAIQMLTWLSGHTHDVTTGIVVYHCGQFIRQSVTTEVEFFPIPNEAIERYVDTMRPFDKAGSYGIQEWIGHAFVKRINGSYNNVVGLPTCEVYALLKELIH
jgi:septum formation protein